ncbi:MAG: hypothetical protein JXA20_05555 [Spirochaetes bacterium]|nr:hypothetical protein [Spirochaetota bacterium]
MSISDCKKEPCPNCNQDNCYNDPNCRTCNGDGYLFFINGSRVAKEEYRKYYNSSVMAEDEKSVFVCPKCNLHRDISHLSPDGQICDYCYEDEENLNEDRKVQLKNSLKKQLLKGANSMSFIEFDNITIHVDDIIKIIHRENIPASFFVKEKGETEGTKDNYCIEIFTRDGEKHTKYFENENECIEKYKKIQEILTIKVEIHKI